MVGCSLEFRSRDLSEWVLFKLVPGALFPGVPPPKPGKSALGTRLGSVTALGTQFSYETDLTSLECQEILNSFQICHSGFLRNEPIYLSTLCNLLAYFYKNFTLLTRGLL